MIELLKDTATSPELKNWPIQYDLCAFMNLYDIGKPDLRSLEEHSRRTVLRFMEDANPQSVEELIGKADEGDLELERDGVVILSCKERELSTDGRLFAKQTFEQRIKQINNEKNIHTHILPLFKQTTMADSELESLKKQHSAIRSMGSNFSLICMDLEKWNLKFRHSLTTTLGENLDDLFGMNLNYTLSHLWFTNSSIFCYSRLTPPSYTTEQGPDGEPRYVSEEGEYHYKGHQGGFEGMK